MLLEPKVFLSLADSIEEENSFIKMEERPFEVIEEEAKSEKNPE